MADFDDNEDWHALKRWWNKSSTWLVPIMILILLGVAGWYGWQWYEDRQNNQAAELYAEVHKGFASHQVTHDVADRVDQLKSDYQRSPYAINAALDMARYFVGQDKMTAAEDELAWVMEHAREKAMVDIAATRKARVLWAQDKPDKALKVLDRDHADAFDALYAEVAGDIQADQGHRDKAYKAYEKALDRLPADVPDQLLQQKRVDNAPAESNDAHVQADAESSHS